MHRSRPKNEHRPEVTAAATVFVIFYVLIASTGTSLSEVKQNMN